MGNAQAAKGRYRAVHYGVAVLAVALALLVRWELTPYLGDRIPYPFFFLAVTLVACWPPSGPAPRTTEASGAGPRSYQRKNRYGSSHSSGTSR